MKKTIILVIIINLVLVLGQVYLSARRATDGAELAVISREIADIRIENQRLKNEIYQASSVERIQQRARGSGARPCGRTVYKYIVTSRPGKMTWRYLVLKILFAAIAFAVLARLAYWQTIKASELTSQALGQRTTAESISAPRGEILAADGFPLAANKESYLLFANPQLTKNIEVTKFQQLLTAISSSDSARITTLLSQPDKMWVPITTKLAPEAKDQITKLEISGLGFENTPVRFYPGGSPSGHLLGFVGKDDNGADRGYFGLEGFYDKQLSGVEGRVVQETDALNRPIVLGSQNYVPSQEGRTLKTSIDRTLQHMIYEKLSAGLKRYQAVAGTVSVLDPATGNIMAMVSLPGYDPGRYQQTDTALYGNPIVSESFEPGSTFKVLVMAAALDAKTIKPDTRCNICANSITVSGYPIRTWNDKYYPDSTMTEIIAHSDNVGMVFVSRSLGKKRMISYIEKFGFGKTTGVDLQEESTPSLRPDSDWREIDLATASFGQGIAVTPLQMLRAVGSLANGGKMMTPRVVTDIITNTSVNTAPQKPGIQVVSPGAAAQVTQMMINSVEQGEVKWAKPQGFVIAGKTGTAQIPVDGHYDEDKTIASFVGFAPAYNPRFVMLVTLREPQSSPWGSETAAPLWFEIANEMLRYYQISPSY